MNMGLLNGHAANPPFTQDWSAMMSSADIVP